MSKLRKKRRRHQIRVKQKRKAKLAKLRKQFSDSKSDAAKKKVLDKVSYKCTLCGACKEWCAANVDLELVDERKKMVKKKMELDTNHDMIKNVREHGNPFGKPDKKHKKSDKLYCC